MQREEFLSHEPSTFTFPHFFPLPNVEETTSGELPGFQKFYVRSIGRIRISHKRYIPPRTKIFHLFQKLKTQIQNPFISRSSLSFLSSFDDKPSRFRRRVKIESPTNRAKPKRNLGRRTKGIRIESRFLEFESGSSYIECGEKRKRRGNASTSHLFRPFFPVDREDFWPRTGSSRGSGTSRVRGSGKYNAVFNGAWNVHEWRSRNSWLGGDAVGNGEDCVSPSFLSPLLPLLLGSRNGSLKGNSSDPIISRDQPELCPLLPRIDSVRGWFRTTARERRRELKLMEERWGSRKDDFQSAIFLSKK